jgi:ATP-binding cassette, subfamily B, multidrug efflux pump
MRRPLLVGMALLIDTLVRNNALVPGVTSLIRWQSRWHVARQNWLFFRNNFTGHIAKRVMAS